MHCSRRCASWQHMCPPIFQAHMGTAALMQHASIGSLCALHPATLTVPARVAGLDGHVRRCPVSATSTCVLRWDGAGPGRRLPSNTLSQYIDREERFGAHNYAPIPVVLESGKVGREGRRGRRAV